MIFPKGIKFISVFLEKVNLLWECKEVLKMLEDGYTF